MANGDSGFNVAGAVLNTLSLGGIEETLQKRRMQEQQLDESASRIAVNEQNIDESQARVKIAEAQERRRAAEQDKRDRILFGDSMRTLLTTVADQEKKKPGSGWQLFRGRIQADPKYAQYWRELQVDPSTVELLNLGDEADLEFLRGEGAQEQTLQDPEAAANLRSIYVKYKNPETQETEYRALGEVYSIMGHMPLDILEDFGNRLQSAQDSNLMFGPVEGDISTTQKRLEAIREVIARTPPDDPKLPRMQKSMEDTANKLRVLKGEPPAGSDPVAQKRIELIEAQIREKEQNIAQAKVLFPLKIQGQQIAQGKDISEIYKNNSETSKNWNELNEQSRNTITTIDLMEYNRQISKEEADRLRFAEWQKSALYKKAPLEAIRMSLGIAGLTNTVIPQGQPQPQPPQGENKPPQTQTQTQDQDTPPEDEVVPEDKPEDEVIPTTQPAATPTTFSIEEAANMQEQGALQGEDARATQARTDKYVDDADNIPDDLKPAFKTLLDVHNPRARALRQQVKRKPQQAETDLYTQTSQQDRALQQILSNPDLTREQREGAIQMALGNIDYLTNLREANGKTFPRMTQGAESLAFQFAAAGENTILALGGDSFDPAKIEQNIDDIHNTFGFGDAALKEMRTWTDFQGFGNLTGNYTFLARAVARSIQTKAISGQALTATEIDRIKAFDPQITDSDPFVVNQKTLAALDYYSKTITPYMNAARDPRAKAQLQVILNRLDDAKALAMAGMWAVASERGDKEEVISVEREAEKYGNYVFTKFGSATIALQEKWDNDKATAVE